LIDEDGIFAPLLSYLSLFFFCLTLIDSIPEIPPRFADISLGTILFFSAFVCGFCDPV